MAVDSQPIPQNIVVIILAICSEAVLRGKLLNQS
jgi:hypothetical protein